MWTRFRLRWSGSVVWLGLVLAVFVATTRASEECVPELIVFGDSLSDNGNLYAVVGVPPSPPYFEGRFSNGPVWVEVLAARLDLDADEVRNFALGGAKTGTDNFAVPGFPGVLTQIDTFVAESTGTDPDALFVVWAGANDFFGEIDDPPARITAAVTNIATAVATLTGVGGKRFLVPNLPDLGKLPDLLAGDPAVAEGATQISLAFNAALAPTLEGLEAQLGIEIIQLNVFSLFDEIIRDPGAFGLTDVTSPCLQVEPPGLCDTPDENLFWDGVHPTAAGHRIIADAAFPRIERFCARLNRFYRGDPNDTGSSDISDAIHILEVLFVGSAETRCKEAADVNDDGSIDVTDAVRLLGWLFGGDGVSTPPAPPGVPGEGVGCGADPEDSPAHLGCVSYTSCQ